MRLPTVRPYVLEILNFGIIKLLFSFYVFSVLSRIECRTRVFSFAVMR